jgi:hypothetical protein
MYGDKKGETIIKGRTIATFLLRWFILDFPSVMLRMLSPDCDDQKHGFTPKISQFFPNEESR